MGRAGLLAATVMALVPAAWAQETRYAIVGDAIPKPLADRPGDAARGRAIVANRSVVFCLMCHSGPIP
jgi:sulfur-oxidizing protein SoxX